MSEGGNESGGTFFEDAEDRLVILDEIHPSAIPPDQVGLRLGQYRQNTMSTTPPGTNDHEKSG